MVYLLVDLLDFGETASYLLFYGPPIAAAVVGFAAFLFPRPLVPRRWLGMASLLTGASTVVVFRLWETNECYEEYESCGSIYPLFELGWLLSVAAVAWILVTATANLIRARRVDDDASVRVSKQ